MPSASAMVAVIAFVAIVGVATVAASGATITAICTILGPTLVAAARCAGIAGRSSRAGDAGATGTAPDKVVKDPSVTQIGDNRIMRGQANAASTANITASADAPQNTSTNRQIHATGHDPRSTVAARTAILPGNFGRSSGSAGST
ncbi:hypothetical protein HOP51_20015 [Halomonas sp. MCCC 1A11036]|uniref:Secreted protein n=1 Tax=Billgrantia zhangzhouensis TaxID=2733481 RepID=A0ABS9AKV1_9GAMM|nr:hypothetical protein [Halomonas zhangzhouensis]MCE8022374.1 hypothetical protein [Halomonas zhangzhouensis]